MVSREQRTSQKKRESLNVDQDWLKEEEERKEKNYVWTKNSWQRKKR